MAHALGGLLPPLQPLLFLALPGWLTRWHSVQLEKNSAQQTQLAQLF
jgi:hypothetical protein